jgi:hypothetical protein
MPNYIIPRTLFTALIKSNKVSDALKNSFENSFKIAIVLTLFNCYNWYLKVLKILW